MKRFNKEEMRILCCELFPNVEFQKAVMELKKNHYVTVVNRGHANRKAYMVCESVLNK